MATFENIVGPKLLAIFDQLTRDKILVKISLKNNEFESLTVVTRTAIDGSDPIFDMDPPKGLITAIIRSKAKSINFEFTSEDRVTHHFNADIKNVTKKNVTLLFPQFIHRHQQRDNFRVKVPFDSYAKLIIDDVELRMAIDNISLGGVFCLCLNKFKSKFNEQQILNDMELMITLGTECVIVGIQQVQVNRLEIQPQPKQFGIAFEFRRIKRNDKKVLVQQIYDFQRYFLQNRLKFFG
jgi:c-di-GMP-binding flagellar brake protein YcgR